MKGMENLVKEGLEHESKELKSIENSVYEKQIFEVYYFGILQYAIHTTNHKQIAQLKEFYEKQGNDFNKIFSSAERQLSKIENPEITLQQFIYSLNYIIKSFYKPAPKEQINNALP